MEYFKKIIQPYKGLRREVYILFISRFVNAIGALIFPFMTLILREKIGLPESEVGLFTALGGLLYAPASLLGGNLADKFGRKKLLLIFQTLGMFSYVICYFMEPSIEMVYVLISASVFFGIAGPSHDAMIGDITSEKDREGAYSLLYLGFNLGFGFAMIFAGRLFAHHLNLMFLIDAVTAFIALALIAIFIRETYDPSEKEETIIDSSERSDMEAAFEGSIIKVLFNRPILIYFALGIFGYRFVYSQWSFLMPMHATFNFGVEEGSLIYGSIGSINAFTVVFFTPVLTSMFTRFSNLRRVVFSGFLFVLGFGILGFISYKWVFYLSVFIFTLGEILEAISVMPFIMNHTPSSHRGRMSSVLPIIMGAGFSVGPLVMGYVLEYTSFEFSWKFAASIVLIASFAMIILERIDRKKTNRIINKKVE
ncbi:MAG: MFS transporter [Eubacteriales bacterium]